ncbi:hypothetical protein PIB30_105599 [Stylosanthes scabra]|uniref:Uncharacterized protein n=1 Tax=Stylosanthes scabra TaxID=79078 RepID=A0ABU6QY22_9FABA|nr:hypothetical protein [Stylosanthes scabra]
MAYRIPNSPLPITDMGRRSFVKGDWLTGGSCPTATGIRCHHIPTATASGGPSHRHTFALSIPILENLIKPRPKEEWELAHLYEYRQFPYPGDEEAMQEFIPKGGMIGTTIGPKGTIEVDKDAVNYQKQLQDKKFEQEALKMWMRMRNEVIGELQEQGFDLE